ncbi:hypothetical protein GCM10018785_27880 [Streptomyces longispororuber]|uniref:Uncharacterized protein n=1 Tax=Streptomyces longispororuber TaxID=68230 RepID=A0A918ZK02_9ACTN|nr:hypothetical protein GCM10018785_27880 [Streptomyces longispororuber]
MRPHAAGPGAGSRSRATRAGSDQAGGVRGAPDGAYTAAAARAWTTARAAASSSGVGLPRTTLITKGLLGDRDTTTVTT